MTEPLPVPAQQPPLQPKTHRLRRRMEAMLGIPATEGNKVTILRNGDQIFPAMLSEIRAATRTIDFLTFVYWRGDIAHEFAHALAERAQDGVRVRVLLDAVGGRLIDRGLLEHMSRCGVVVEWYRKPWRVSPFKQNHRTHRKLLICDERVGFTGGVGIAEEWCGDARDETEWRDTHVRVEGPAVDGLAAAFSQNWAETGHPLCDELDTFAEHPHVGTSVVQVARGSATVGWNDMATVFHAMLESAERQLRIQTAYFMPSPTFEQLLLETAARGVEVDLLLPGPHADKRVSRIASESTYDRLIEGGIRIWNFQPSMLHTKITVIDGAAAVVGSANVNRRSLYHDEEVVLAVFDPAVAAVLDRQFEEDLERSELIEGGRWAQRPVHWRATQKASTLIHRWL